MPRAPLSRISANVIFYGRSDIAHNLADRGEAEAARDCSYWSWIVWMNLFSASVGLPPRTFLLPNSNIGYPSRLHCVRGSLITVLSLAITGDRETGRAPALRHGGHMKSEISEIQRLNKRLIQEAEQAREHAKKLPPGRERDALLKKARRAEITDRWLSSSELKPPN